MPYICGNLLFLAALPIFLFPQSAFRSRIPVPIASSCLQFGSAPSLMVSEGCRSLNLGGMNRLLPPGCCQYPTYIVLRPFSLRAHRNPSRQVGQANSTVCRVDTLSSGPT